MCEMMRAPKSSLKKKNSIVVGSTHDAAPNPFVAPSSGSRSKGHASDFGFGPPSSQVPSSGKGMSAVPGLCVPTPSEFRAAALGNRSSAPSQIRSMESASSQGAPMSASVPVHNMMTTASKTRLEKHARQMRALQRMQPSINTTTGAIKKGSKTPQWPHGNPLTRLLMRMKTNWQNPNVTTATDPGPLTPEETQHVVREFDRDVAEAILSVGGHFMGISPGELSQSQGMRILVARNIRWFQNTPDFLKLMGLMAAKKMNNILAKRGFTTMSLDTINPPPPTFTCWDHLPERSGQLFTPEALLCGGNCQSVSTVTPKKKASKNKTEDAPPPPKKACRRKSKDENNNTEINVKSVKKEEQQRKPKKESKKKGDSSEYDTPANIVKTKQTKPRKSKAKMVMKEEPLNEPSEEEMRTEVAAENMSDIDPAPPALVSDSLPL